MRNEEVLADCNQREVRHLKINCDCFCSCVCLYSKFCSFQLDQSNVKHFNILQKFKKKTVLVSEGSEDFKLLTKCTCSYFSD